MALLILGLVGPFDKSLARACVERYVVGGWVEAVIGGPCFPCGNLFLRLSGELPRSDHAAAILLCNHQLDTDWLFAWEVLRVVQAHHLLKIVLLDEMRKVPIVGWAMEMAGFVFLTGRGGDAEKIRAAACA
ncbi:MAG: 1-acyl-sn-glycerol-3-phosphate acyltransferase, partial [Pseudomonadota bacterium]